MFPDVKFWELNWKKNQIIEIQNKFIFCKARYLLDFWSWYQLDINFCIFERGEIKWISTWYQIFRRALFNCLSKISHIATILELYTAPWAPDYSGRGSALASNARNSTIHSRKSQLDWITFSVLTATLVIEGYKGTWSR